MQFNFRFILCKKTYSILKWAGGFWFDLFEPAATALEFPEDLLDGGRPDERRGVGVPGGGEVGDGLFQVGNALEGAAPYAVLIISTADDITVGVERLPKSCAALVSVSAKLALKTSPP